MNPVVRYTAATLVATGLALAGTAAASADTTPSPTPAPTSQTLAQLKAHCDQEVQRRLGTLSADLSFVNQAPALTSADRSTLQGQINADTSGLTALDATIRSDTTLSQARSDCQKIVTGYRVYVLEEPKIHEVIAADTVSAVDHELSALVPELQKLIDDSDASASAKQKAQADLNDLQGKVTAAQTSVSGVVASVINLQPSGYPGTTTVLQSGHQNIETARGDLKGARDDVADILHVLGRH